MAISAEWYTTGFKAAFNKEIDFDSDTIKVMLLSRDSYFDPDAVDYLDDVIGDEIGSAGYTAGGATLTNKTVTCDSGVFKLDASNVSWSGIIVSKGAVIYDDTPATNATKPLLGYVNFGEELSSAAGQTFTIVWKSAGMLTVDLS